MRSICARLDGIPLAIELAAAADGRHVTGRDRCPAHRPLPPLDRPGTVRDRTPADPADRGLVELSAPHTAGARCAGSAVGAAAGFHLDDAVAVSWAATTSTSWSTPSWPPRQVAARHGRLRPMVTARPASDDLQSRFDLAADSDEEEVRDRHAAHFHTVADRLLLGPQGQTPMCGMKNGSRPSGSSEPPSRGSRPSNRWRRWRSCAIGSRSTRSSNRWREWTTRKVSSTHSLDIQVLSGPRRRRGRRRTRTFCGVNRIRRSSGMDCGSRADRLDRSCA